MKILIGSLLIIGLCVSPCAATIMLSDEQFENMGYIDREMRKQFPGFTGFNGSKAKMEVMGVPDKMAAVYIAGLDIPALVAADVDEKKRKFQKAYQKFEVAGITLTKEDMKALGMQGREYLEGG